MQKKTIKKIYVLASVQIQCVQIHTQTESEKEENN